MKGSQSHEFETDIPASELWKIYGTLRAAELVPKLLPHVLAKVELVSGDGGVGTILQLTFPPGIPGLHTYREKFIKVDNENYMKEAAAIDGDILKELALCIPYEGHRELTNTTAMEGSLCHEFETGLPAAEVWEVYGGLLVGQLIPQLLPDMFSKVELVKGDGGVGTVLLVTFPPGTPGLEFFKEEFIKVDNENYIKEAKVIEGGFLDHGFQKYLVRIEVIGETDKTSIIRSTIEYKVDDEHTSNTSYVSTSGLAAIAEAITKYIKEKKSAD